MSMSITSTTAAMPSASTGTAQPKETTEIKSEAVAKLHDREQQVTSTVQGMYEHAGARLASIAEVAQENDYMHLANRAMKAADTVYGAQQQSADRLEQRFDQMENLLMSRPEGGYNLSTEQADSLIGHVESKTQARLDALADRHDTMSERLDGLKETALANGHDGEHIDKLSEKLDARYEQQVARVEARTDKTIEMIQGRIDEAYDVEPGPLVAGEIEVVDDPEGTTHVIA